MTRTVIKGPPERSCTRSPRANSGAVSERAGTDESALIPRIRAASSDDRFAKVGMRTSPVIFQTWDRLFAFPIKFLVSRAYSQRMYPTGKSLPRSGAPARESSPSRKNFPLSPSGKSILELAPSRAHQRGVSRSSRHVGRGMRWMRRRQARLLSSRTRALPHAAKACGPDIPTLISSLAERFR
jgi:hypothetical protein